MTLSVAVNFKQLSFLIVYILIICRAASQENNSTNKTSCGYVIKTLTIRVVGGSPAEIGGWPWIANVGYDIDQPGDGIDFKCAGSLVSSRHVLTAGHCVYGSSDRLFVRLGEYDFSTDDEANPIDITVKKVTIHPKYNETSYENDIAILELSEEVEFTDLIHPICLPVKEDIKNHNFVNNYLFVAGWGSTSTDGPFSNVLLETQVPVVDRETCANAYRYYKNIVVDDRVICAGYEGGTDSCEGDSGGPLIYPSNQIFYLVGIVSGGSERCAEPGIPGLYTRVTQFLDFISSCTN